MKYDNCYLPNGQQVSVSPVFNGYKFKLKNPDLYTSFPPEWTISLWTETEDRNDAESGGDPAEGHLPFTEPSLENDKLYLSSMSMPSSKDLKPNSAPTRQVAMVMWVTFLWYFQEQEPNPHVTLPGGPDIPEAGRVTKDWKLSIQQKGILHGKSQMVKLERLGIIASEDASVGMRPDSLSFQEMFITQRAFWQLDPRVFLITISSAESSPGNICPGPAWSLDSLGTGFPFGAGPNTFGTFVPSYYPPQPLQYTFTNNVRHPIRSKNFRQGEVFYARYIPSGGHYFTFRVPVLPDKGPLKSGAPDSDQPDSEEAPDLCLGSEKAHDLELIHRWMKERPTDTALARKGPIKTQLEFLKERLSCRHSLPVLACWDSKAVGYFEIFWVLEDSLGHLLGDVGDWDRGVRCFVGNEDFTEPRGLEMCLSSLIHHCWLYDQRTNTIMFDIRADNEKYVSFLDSSQAFAQRFWLALNPTYVHPWWQGN